MTRDGAVAFAVGRVVGFGVGVALMVAAMVDGFRRGIPFWVAVTLGGYVATTFGVMGLVLLLRRVVHRP